MNRRRNPLLTAKHAYHQGDIDIAARTHDWAWLETRALDRLTKSRERMGVYPTDRDARSAPEEPPA